jgi:large subunit ribosomal protein L3
MSRRVGLIAKKVGMTTYFLASGERLAATVLQVSSNQISAQIGFSAPTHLPTGEAIVPRKIESRLAYTALQVAATDTTSRRGITKQVRGHLRKAGINKDKKIIREFKVTKDAIVPLGTVLSAAHFVPGQKIDVKAKSRGKGFQGVMKRHGFHGLRASHGVSVSHRSAGSTGQNQSPGRVFPGKKMAGRMGGDQRTGQNLEVLRIDTVKDVILVKGNVPGPEGGHVLLTDAKKALVGRAANALNKGLLPDGGRATGEEGREAYLPGGIVDLPFPAGTREMASALPEIVEVAPLENPKAS